VIKVLLVDDHEIVRQGLRFVLEHEADIEVVGECTDGSAALTAISSLRPDVVILDMKMPGQDGMSVLQSLQGHEVRPAVIVLTSYPADHTAMVAVQAGAISYLSKSGPVEQVVEAVRAAAGGASVLDPQLTAMLVRHLQEGARDAPLSRLSPRERDVLAALTRGRSNREIARALSLSEQTVKSHVSSILTKLDLQDRTQAAIFGLQQGLVPLREALQEDQ
jgi:NarL family two-component system response regulator LiaR